MASMPASATLRCSPRERARGLRLRISSNEKPRLSRARAASRDASCRSRPRLRGPKQTSFSTVSAKRWSSGFCMTRPQASRSRRNPRGRSSSSPSSSICPPPGTWMPLRIRSRVDLPLPVEPSTPRTSPLSTSRLIPSRARYSMGVPGR